jgi:hypothetical protein
MNKISKLLVLFLVFSLVSTTDNFSGAFTERAAFLFDEAWVVAAPIFAYLSMQRQPEFDPSQSRLYDIQYVDVEAPPKPVTIDPKLQQLINHYHHDRVFPSYEHVLGQQPQPVVDLSDTAIEKPIPVQPGPLKHAVSTTKKVEGMLANTGLHDQPWDHRKPGPASRAFKFELTLGNRQAARNHFNATQLEQRLNQAVAESQEKLFAFANLKATSSLKLENAADEIDDAEKFRQKPARARARDQITAIRTIVESFIKVGIQKNDIQAYKLLAQIADYINTYPEDKQFAFILDQLFGEPILRILDTCFDKDSGELIRSYDKKVLLANVFLDMVENKELFEYLLENSEGKLQSCEFVNLVSDARILGVKDTYILQNLHENKLLDRSLPKVSAGRLQQCLQNSANVRLQEIRRLINKENPELNSAREHFRFLKEHLPHGSDVVYLAQCEFYPGVAQILKSRGIEPYIKNPLWTRFTEAEQLRILESKQASSDMALALKESHDCLVTLVQEHYKFPNMGNLTSKQQTLFNDFTKDLIYRAPQDRTKYLVNGVWNSTNPEHAMLRQRLFLPNGILKAYSDSGMARAFKLDPTQSKTVQTQLLYDLNNLLSYDTSDASVKRVVDLGLKATVSATNLTGSESMMWSEVQVAVTKCLAGSKHYQSLCSIPELTSMGDVLQQITPLVRECQIMELKEQKRVVLSESVTQNPNFQGLLPATQKEISFDSSDAGLGVALQLEHQTHAAKLLAAQYNVDYDAHAHWLVPLTQYSNVERMNVLSSIFDRYTSGNASAEITRVYNALYGKNKILRAFEDFDWVKNFKLNSNHSIEFQNKTARLANQFLFQYQNTAAVLNLAQLERGMADDEWISSINTAIDQGLEAINQANINPDMAVGYHEQAFGTLHQIDKVALELFPEYTNQLFPRESAPIPYDVLTAAEMGETKYVKFQRALNAVHIYFNPNDFTEAEVRNANPAYREKRFSHEMVWKPLRKTLHEAGFKTIKLNTDLDPKIQEALVLTTNRLLAIRSDLKNAAHIDRALIYIELASNVSEDTAYVYLDTAEAMYKALNGNQAYAPFLSKESLPSNASVEVQQSLLESCRQQEKAFLIVPGNNEIKMPEQVPELVCGTSDIKTPEMECGTEIPEDNAGFKESRCGGGVNQRPEPEFQGPCIAGDQVPEPLHMPKQTLPPLHGPTLETEVDVDESSVKVDGSETKIDDVEVETETEEIYIDVDDVDLTDPVVQLDLEKAVEQWLDADSMNRLADVVVDFNDPAHSEQLQEIIKDIQPLVDYFNNHPEVKRRGYFITAEQLVHHVTHGNIRRSTNVTGLHDEQLKGCCFEAIVKDTCKAHGETEAAVQSIKKEFGGKYKDKKTTTRFGPGWTHDRIIRVILDAIIDDRLEDGKQVNGDREVVIKTRCGMQIGLQVKPNGKIISYYPLRTWMRTKPVECGGKCYKELATNKAAMEKVL